MEDHQQGFLVGSSEVVFVQPIEATVAQKATATATTAIGAIGNWDRTLSRTLIHHQIDGARLNADIDALPQELPSFQCIQLDKRPVGDGFRQRDGEKPLASVIDG